MPASVKIYRKSKGWNLTTRNICDLTPFFSLKKYNASMLVVQARTSFASKKSPNRLELMRC